MADKFPLDLSPEKPVANVEKMPAAEIEKVEPKQIATPDPAPIEAPERQSLNFFAEFELKESDKKFRYITFLVLALLVIGTLFLLKPKIESLLIAQPTLEQTYNPVSAIPTSMSLEINNPDDELLVFDKSLLVSGQTTPKSTIIISDGNQNWGLQASDQGNFSEVISLQDGINQIGIYAFDPQGSSKSDTRTIYMSEESL